MESSESGNIGTHPNSPLPVTRLEAETSTPFRGNDTTTDGLIGELRPLNREAKHVFHVLATRRYSPFYEYHCNFIRLDSTDKHLEPAQLSGAFTFSLHNLPEFAPLGWRIGRGRNNLKNLGVDILLMVEEDDKNRSEVAGIHARFALVKGGGGFFLIADNIRGKAVTLNGEVLCNEQRFIPYRNAIGIGECFFTLKFPTRTKEQDDQFQADLAEFYRQTLLDSVSIVSPTPSKNEVIMGDWIVRRAIAKGTFGHVYAVTHTRTGKAAAAKELWRTPHNSRKVDEEISITKYLLDIKHKHLGTPFDLQHETVYSEVEKARVTKLLDDTWRPRSSDVIDKYTLFSPLSTSTFYSVIDSRASVETRTVLFTQVLLGLAYLHSKRVCHRDIKPGNLTVQSFDPPLAQIIDFGCATTKDSILYDYPGTLPYLAPEQRLGDYHGRQVDYWAIALVGLEIVGYRLPNRQLNTRDFEEIHKWLNKRPLEPMIRCCKGMLKWDPNERMTADYVLQHFLAQYQEKPKTNKRALTE